MIGYATRRVLIGIPVLFGITLVSFVFVQMIPGDPVRAMLNPELAVSPEYLERRRLELGLDRSLLIQYTAWLREVMNGNLGYSYTRRVAVTQMIGERLGPTALLTSTGIGFALLMGVPLGILAAIRQNSLIDYVASAEARGFVGMQLRLQQFGRCPGRVLPTDVVKHL
jgi:peptide/nickel transport system permease protein